MNAAAIFDLVQKGLTVVSMLVAAGTSAAPALAALANLVSGAQEGTVTDEDLAKTEALLDSMIAEFNKDMGG